MGKSGRPARNYRTAEFNFIKIVTCRHVLAVNINNSRTAVAEATVFSTQNKELAPSAPPTSPLPVTLEQKDAPT